MSRFLCLLLLGFTAVHASAQSDGEPAPDPNLAVREAVDAGNFLFRKAFEARDAEALAALYSEDARVIAPGAEPAPGRPAIAEFWKGVFEDVASVRLETLSVESAGDLAYEDGVVHLVAHDGSESSARYVVVWKRVGRRWHLHRDIWNGGAAPEAPAESPPAPPLAPELELP